MIKMDGKKGIIFDYINVIDFWIISFASVVIKDTPEEKYMRWIKDDPNDYLYKYLYTTTLKMIIKNCILSIEMP